MKTPRYKSTIIAAGGSYTIYDLGRWFTMLSITGATQVGVSLDDESPQLLPAQLPFEVPAGAHKITLTNPALVPVTVETVISDAQIMDTRTNTILGLILASLGPFTTVTPIADTLLAATGGLGTLIIAANAARRRIVIEANDANAGIVYLGDTNAVSNVNKASTLIALGCWTEVYTGAVYGVGNDALETVHGYELS